MYTFKVWILNSIRTTVLSILYLTLLFLGVNPVLAQEAPQIMQGEIEAFFDDFFDSEISQGNIPIPGAAIVLVKDGEILFSKGYGYADPLEEIPIEVDDTVFFVESVSKSFTATAIMQLVEKGLLNLETDVNEYLTLFQLEDNFSNPVTVADLLVHTGGFDDTDIGAYARSEDEVIPLGEYLKNNMPPRVMPPNNVVSYSNYGFALAGLLIEEVSELSFVEYMEQKILRPLQMNSSNFVISDEMAQNLSDPYFFAEDEWQSRFFLYHNYRPAGALKATVRDMANFMVAHLQGGIFQNEQIIGEIVLKKMQQQQFTHHLKLPGWTYGFYEYFQNERRAIMHGGANYLGHSSKLFLIPEENLGFFLALNTFNVGFRQKLIKEFMDHFYPSNVESDIYKPAEIFKDGSRFAGSYFSTRQSRNTVEKITMLLGQLQLKTKANIIEIRYPQGMQQSENWIKIEPLLYKNLENDSLLVFGEDNDGRITHMFKGTEAFEKLPWHLSANIQLGFLLFFIVVFLSVLILWPLKSLLTKNKFYKSLPKIARRSLVLAWSLSTLNIMFLTILTIVFLNYQVEIAFGMPTPIKVLFVVPYLSMLLTMGALLLCFFIWKNKQFPLFLRVHYTVLTISAIGFNVFLSYWNLILSF